jgi:hypothetical protein
MMLKFSVSFLINRKVIIMAMKNKTAIAILTTVLAVSAVVPNLAFAAKECFFYGTRSVTINSLKPIGNEGGLHIFKPGTEGFILDYDVLTNTPTLTTKCNVGPDGIGLGAWREAPAASKVSTVEYNTQAHNIALFATNIPGIYYSVKMRANPGNISSLEQFVPWTTDIPAGSLPYESGFKFPLHSGSVGFLDSGRQHNVFINFYQDKTFKGTTEKYIKPLQTNTRLGYFVFGNNSDGNDNVSITMGDFSLPIIQP